MNGLAGVSCVRPRIVLVGIARTCLSAGSDLVGGGNTNMICSSFAKSQDLLPSVFIILEVGNEAVEHHCVEVLKVSQSTERAQ